MSEHFTFNQKTRLLSKLFAVDCNTEGKLKALDMERILKIPGISIPEMNLRTSKNDEGRQAFFLSGRWYG